MELENHPNAFEAFQIAEGHLEVVSRLEFDASRMPSKKAPLAGNVVLVDGVTEKGAYWIHLHRKILTDYLPIFFRNGCNLSYR